MTSLDLHDAACQQGRIIRCLRTGSARHNDHAGPSLSDTELCGVDHTKSSLTSLLSHQLEGHNATDDTCGSLVPASHNDHAGPSLPNNELSSVDDTRSSHTSLLSQQLEGHNATDDVSSKLHAFLSSLCIAPASLNNGEGPSLTSNEPEGQYDAGGRSANLQVSPSLTSSELRTHADGADRSDGLQTPSRLSSSLQACSSWSPWTPSAGHRWVVGTQHPAAQKKAKNSRTRPQCRKAAGKAGPASSAAAGQAPSSSAPSTSSGQAASHWPQHQVLDARTWQAVQLPNQLGGGSACDAAWTAWACTGHLLVCQRDGRLCSFQPGTSICHIRSPGATPTHSFDASSLISPSGGALLWPCSVEGTSAVCMLGLPTLAESHRVSCPQKHAQRAEFQPGWLGWSPKGDSYSIAWHPSLDCSERWLHLQMYAAAAGGLKGEATLPWAVHQKYLQYQWMSSGDGIVVLIDKFSHEQWPNEVAKVVSCSGAVLQTIDCPFWSRVARMSPSGEFLALHGNDPYGNFADPTVLVIYHLPSGRIVSDQLDGMDAIQSGSAAWSSSSQLCTIQADCIDFCQIVHLCGPADASGVPCNSPKQLQRGSGVLAATSFSPYQQLLVEVVRSRYTQARLLIHWEWAVPGVAPTFHIVRIFSVADKSGALHVEDIAWHPNPSAHVYALVEGDEYLHLISARTHILLRSWPMRLLFSTAQPRCMPSTLTWSPDGSQLFLASKRGMGARTLVFDSP